LTASRFGTTMVAGATRWRVRIAPGRDR
jgi:hypothetical protein